MILTNILYFIYSELFNKIIFDNMSVNGPFNGVLPPIELIISILCIILNILRFFEYPLRQIGMSFSFGIRKIFKSISGFIKNNFVSKIINISSSINSVSNMFMNIIRYRN
jgi:hypothetical protein